MIVLTKTTYLEMFEPPADRVTRPRDDGYVRRLVSPSVEEYRALYRDVGLQWNWVEREIKGSGNGQ